MDLDSDGEEQVRSGRRKSGRSGKTFKSTCVSFLSLFVCWGRADLAVSFAEKWSSRTRTTTE